MMLDQVGLLLLEGALTAGLLLTLFHIRHKWGLSPLYVALGVLQHLQVMLATTIYVEILPDIVVSPGSVVLFSASLFAVLLVYIDGDAVETRKLIYGLVMANIALAAISYLAGLHLASPLTRNIFDLPAHFFAQDLRVMVVGTLVLFIDAVLIIVIYEALSRRLQQRMFLRIYLSMTCVLLLDQLMFATGAFFDAPNYRSILYSGLVGKFGAAFFYSVVLSIYVRLAVAGPTPSGTGISRFDVFQFLSYRQKYNLLGEQYDELEDRVNARTAELNQANELLTAEVVEHQTTESMLRQREQELEQLSRQLITTQETERRALARELHDEVGQSLTAIKINIHRALQGASDTDKMQLNQGLQIVDDTMEQVRGLSLQLRPAMLDDLGLVSALEWLVSVVAQRASLSIDFQADDFHFRLPPDTEIACFRIVQETLTNVMRHAHAKHVDIVLRKTDGHVQLMVRDDGVGFKLHEIKSGTLMRGGFGLLGMQERAELIEGSLEIDSTPDGGTVVQLVCPVKTDTDVDGEKS